MKYITYILLIFALLYHSALANTLQHAKVYNSINEANISEYYISEKLDGFRAYWDGKSLISKNGYPFNAPNWYTEKLGQIPLDGELWIDRGQFELLISILNSTDTEDQWHLINYMIFDMPNELVPFKERVKKMTDYIPSLNLSYVQMIPQVEVKSIAELDQLLNIVLQQNGEGLMLHHKNAFYGSGKVNHLLKLKKHDEKIGIVLGYNSGKGKYKRKVGSLNLQLDDGQIIRVGSGLTDKLRESPPKIGQRVAIIHNGFTKSGKLKFARFKRILDEGLE